MHIFSKKDLIKEYEKSNDLIARLVYAELMEIHPDTASVFLTSTLYNCVCGIVPHSPLPVTKLLSFADKCRAYINMLRGMEAGAKARAKEKVDGYVVSPDGADDPAILPIFLDTSDPLHLFVVEDNIEHTPILRHTIAGDEVITRLWNKEEEKFD